MTSTLNHWQNCHQHRCGRNMIWFKMKVFLLSDLFQFFFENLSPKNVFISWLINYEGVINNGWAIMQILPRRNAKCHNKCIKFNWENHGGFKQKMHIDKRYRTIHIKDLKCRKHFPARAYSIWNYPSVKNI